MKNVLLGIAVLFGLSLFVFTCNYLNDAASTVYKETKPSALLSKYEWFKNASATLDQKSANIQMYQNQIADFKKDFPKVSEAPRDERETYNLRKSEAIGLVASYNQLASEYNSQMAKINWAFCNKGSMPASNLEPLPRDFKPYLTSF